MRMYLLLRGEEGISFSLSGLCRCAITWTHTAGEAIVRGYKESQFSLSPLTHTHTHTHTTTTPTHHHHY